jgi:hypothetical protein
MRRIGLVVILTLSLILAALAAEAKPAGKVCECWRPARNFFVGRRR